ncbi:DUF2087 domain-containing protein [Microbacterium esteraromaticum]|uniref:DUF2087 domain-containing protein n=1 Tax=Microbacterium esteraromaticum TaxID=57043 RepID=UPI001C96D734|nr:DUF2087 domain-containing protein [Microbacterium esteraromaticum]MBY6060509.1 DUF2087 domain-containing protein [Microbacterium esteraromaticum]
MSDAESRTPTNTDVTGPDATLRPILAALANPAARETFARVTLGELPADRTSRQERALAQLEKAGLLARTSEGWKVDDENLRRLLQQGSRRRPNTGPERFLTTDGRIDRYPSQHDERDTFLRFLAGRVLAADETLSEAELGSRLDALTSDTARLRRALVDHGILIRDPAGTAYRLAVAQRTGPGSGSRTARCTGRGRSVA